MWRRSWLLFAKDKEASLAAKHAGKRAPPPRENTVDYQPLAYRFLGNYWKIKQKRPKSQWQINAEKDFLAEQRRDIPEGFAYGLTESDVSHLHPTMQRILSLKNSDSQEIMKAKKRLMVAKFGKHLLDANSLE